MPDLDSFFKVTIHPKTGDYYRIQCETKIGKNITKSEAKGELRLTQEVFTKLEKLINDPKEYGTCLGQHLFQSIGIITSFVTARKEAVSASKASYLRICLFIVATDEELISLRWERLCAPTDLDCEKWRFLRQDQQVPYSIYIPSSTVYSFESIDRKNLRALVLVACPIDASKFKLSYFDVWKSVANICSAFGDSIEYDVLATPKLANPNPAISKVEESDLPISDDLYDSLMKHYAGLPTLHNLKDKLSKNHYTFLHIVCHGGLTGGAEPKKPYLALTKEKNEHHGVEEKLLIHSLQGSNIPHLVFLCTCHSANSSGGNFGGLAGRLTRDFGIPAVVAMTEEITIPTAEHLAKQFYEQLIKHGMVDLALVEATAGLGNDRPDIIVPALFSRLEGKSLFSYTTEMQVESSQQKPPPNNTSSSLLKPPHTVDLVGRESLVKELEKLHKDIGGQESLELPVTFIHGIAGVGKTELAKEYVRQLKKEDYEGGICWLEEKNGVVNSIAQGIVDFATDHLKFQGSERQDVNAQAIKCLKLWKDLNKDRVQALVVVDNLTEFNEEVRDLLSLPIYDKYFKVLVTVSANPSVNINSFKGKNEKDLIKEVDSLKPEDALVFLGKLINEARVSKEQEKAKELCAFLGYLPLAMELVGLYLRGKEKSSLADVYDDLQETKYFHKILSKGEKSINAAFCLSWKQYLGSVDEDDIDDYKLLGYLFSLFSSGRISEILIKEVLKKLGKDKRDIERLMDIPTDSLIFSLVQKDESKAPSETGYRLHRVVQKFLGYKLEEESLEYRKSINRSFCSVMVEKAKRISANPTHDELEVAELSISHIIKLALDAEVSLKDNDKKDWLTGDEIIEVFLGIGRYYEGIGFYVQAKEWYQKCQPMNLEQGCPNFVKVQNALAYINFLQKDYRKATDLYRETYDAGLKWFEAARKEDAIEAWKNVVESQDGFGYLLCLLENQGSHGEGRQIGEFAKRLLDRALEERELILKESSLNVEERSFDVAQSYSHLGYYYQVFCRNWDEAKTFYEKALKIYENSHTPHPLVAESFNNLGLCYFNQNEDKLLEESKKLHVRALNIYIELYGEAHYDVGLTSNLLAEVYMYLDLNLVEEECRKALNIGENLDSKPLILDACVTLTHFWLKKEDYDQAKPYCERALCLAKTHDRTMVDHLERMMQRCSQRIPHTDSV